jgi:hypothetical protein
LFPLFAIGVVDIRGKFTAAVVEISGNLPLVLLTDSKFALASTIPGVTEAKFGSDACH